ncbi:hypothetical protein [Mesorhizobium mediterraneum]|uniref:hypothetical protein n=1 Tax=Mesorhizobium mediterraneum TaxID=43617 RepID=UPI0017826939|nr:hypothetical protein [Mesorhizobium mediterraneum]
MKSTFTDRIHEIADRLAQLAPSHRDPERFHEEKSELVDALRRLAANDNIGAQNGRAS